MELAEIIERELKRKRPLVIAVDGRCGSGKSTLSRRLCDAYPGSVIHMDDFFLRPEQRTRERLAETGGNIDYERFEKEVVQPLREGRRSFEYRRYDCSEERLAGTVKVPGQPLIVVEGAYSCHPRFSGIYDLKLFLDIDGPEQISRLRRRSGERMLARFLREWIPMEEDYFDSFHIREQCDILLDGRTSPPAVVSCFSKAPD